MSAALRWLRDWGGFLLAAVVAVVCWLLRRHRGAPTPGEKVALEFAAIEAAKAARQMQTELGHQETLEHVRERYAEAYRRELAEDARKIAELEKRPDLLAKRLARAGCDRDYPRKQAPQAPTVDYGGHCDRSNGYRVSHLHGPGTRRRGGNGSL